MQQFLHMMAANHNMLIGGALVGAMSSLLSVYVVLRRMSLISEGVSHAGFGGLSVALLVGAAFPALDMPIAGGHGSPIWWQVITGIFCLGTALLIGYVSRKKRVSEDAAIGIFLVTAIALGVFLLYVRRIMFTNAATPPELEQLLFGDFNAIKTSDVLIMAGTTVIVFLLVGLLYYQFLYTTLDEEMARVNGVPTRLVNTLQLALVSLIIVICGRSVGFFMITALTIIPGATANMIFRSFNGVLITSVIIGTLGTLGATMVALVPPFGQFPSGPIVVLLLFLLFAIVWTIRHFVKPRALEEEATFAPVEPARPGAFGHGHTH